MTSKNENEQNDFIIKYTDIDIFSIDIIKHNIFKLSDIVKRIKELYPNNYIILYVTVCRRCDDNIDFSNICSDIVEQTILKNPKRRGSFSLSSTNIENIEDLLLSNNNNFQKIFDFVKNNLRDEYKRHIFNNYSNELHNDDICYILSEYLILKNK